MPERLLSAAACAEIAERAAKATAGPWKWSRIYELPYGMPSDAGPLWTLENPEQPDGGVGDGVRRAINGELVLANDRTCDLGGRPLDCTPDFEFIAAARSDIPALLATVAALREALKPFAAIVAIHAGDEEADECRVSLINVAHGDAWYLHEGEHLIRGDLRRAAAVYRETA